MTATISTFVNKPTGAACNRGANIVKVAHVTSISIVHGTTFVTVNLDFFKGFATLVSAVPASMLNKVSVLLCNIVTDGNLGMLVRRRVSFGRIHGLVVTDSVLILKLNNTILSVTNIIALSNATLDTVANVTLGLILPRRRTCGPGRPVRGGRRRGRWYGGNVTTRLRDNSTFFLLKFLNT